MELTPHLPWTHIFIKLHWGTLLLSVTPFRSSQTPDLSWIINDGKLVWGNTFRWSSFLIQFIGQKGNSVVKKQQQWLCSPDLLMEEQSQLGLEDEVTVTDITHISKQTTQSTDVLACRDGEDRTQQEATTYHEYPTSVFWFIYLYHVHTYTSHDLKYLYILYDGPCISAAVTFNFSSFDQSCC